MHFILTDVQYYYYYLHITARLTDACKCTTCVCAAATLAVVRTCRKDAMDGRDSIGEDVTGQAAAPGRAAPCAPRATACRDSSPTAREGSSCVYVTGRPAWDHGKHTTSEHDRAPPRTAMQAVACCCHQLISALQFEPAKLHRSGRAMAVVAGPASGGGTGKRDKTRVRKGAMRADRHGAHGPPQARPCRAPPLRPPATMPPCPSHVCSCNRTLSWGDIYGTLPTYILTPMSSRTNVVELQYVHFH
nr:unnamed protein product [Digitaria exilis]